MDLVDKLRGDQGCPWDREQSPQSLTRYLIEELYELVEAIETDDQDAVCEELGDVLFHLVFIVACYQEKGRFNQEDVVNGVVEKMIRRHPHVFGEKKIDNTEAVRIQWKEIKSQEKKNKENRNSPIDSISGRLPALMRALQISEYAAGTGFDWKDIEGVMKKAEEEWAEFKDEILKNNSTETGRTNRSVEFGDYLFTLVNVARFMNIHPETALNASIRKFESRFRYLEEEIQNSGRNINTVSQEEKNEIWDKIKATEP
ncbi:MAG: nucleoside triphosphate pyrophosphohydrolase [Thermodesulfobacteriota bacterium]